MKDEHRKPGRPKQFDDTVSVRLPAPLHDEMSREALRRHVELSVVIRERLREFRISKLHPS